MKTTLALRVRSQRTLEKAWLAISRNARSSKSEETKNEIATFAGDLNRNLRRISKQLQQQAFIFPPAKGLKIPKDKADKIKFRPLVLAKVESRVVQRAVHDVLTTVPGIQSYIRTPHSFGGVKKTEDDESAAVPAAIKAVLDAIGAGGTHIVRSDITSFFTRISKSAVTAIVAGCIDDVEFMNLFGRAIAVELENMAQLRYAAAAFPIQDVGVAQGNSLSPLLGNIILYEFDKELNKNPDVRCVRYIDDFIIIAPSKNVASNTYQKALHILGKLGMSTSITKTSHRAVSEGFEFLGIELMPGLIRPSKKSRERVVASVEKTIATSEKGFKAYVETGELDKNLSLSATLQKVSGIMHGWGKHYRFCNDSICLSHIDTRISAMLKGYFVTYRNVRQTLPESKRWRLLGIEATAQIERTEFIWPTIKKKSQPVESLQIDEVSDPALLS